MVAILQGLIHIATALLLPPLLLVVINKTKAAFGGRVGPPLLQPYYDLFKLVRKGSVISTTTTTVFRAGPVIGLATVLLAAMMAPQTAGSPPLSFAGDAIFLAYLLGLARFFTASAALDTGSPFEGMGAAREVTFACLAEPAFFFGMLVLSRLSSSVQLSEMFGASMASYWPAAGSSLALVVASWSLVALVENCRVPFDDPNTHLELTMIHEVMVLDHGGPALGMILYSASVKLFLFGALIVRIVCPLATGSLWIDWPVFVFAMLAFAVAVGVVESVMARLSMPHVPALLMAACLMSLFAVVLLIR